MTLPRELWRSYRLGLKHGFLRKSLAEDVFDRHGAIEAQEHKVEYRRGYTDGVAAASKLLDVAAERVGFPEGRAT